jgi:hypothetical protein
VFYLSHGTFREPYLIDIWYPVATLGIVFGASRLFAFLFWKSVKNRKRVSLENFLLRDYSILWLFFVVIALWWLPRYLTGFLFSVMMGYFFARMPVYTQYIIELLPDKTYKATFLSVKGFIEWWLWILFPLALWAVMWVSYELWYALLGWLFIVAWCGWWLYLRKG